MLKNSKYLKYMLVFFGFVLLFILVLFLTNYFNDHNNINIESNSISYFSDTDNSNGQNGSDGSTTTNNGVDYTAMEFGITFGVLGFIIIVLLIIYFIKKKRGTL